MIENKTRVMWLLNHSSARKFEVAMLKKIGIDEIFLPKIMPKDIGFRTASVDFSEDKNLTIPAEELAVLNAQNWYDAPSKEAWDIANKYFDVLFFILVNPNLLQSIKDNFKGVAIWRVYGHVNDMSYTLGLSLSTKGMGARNVQYLGNRFWFGEAYAHLHEQENDFLKKRRMFLPLGMANVAQIDGWTGSRKSIYFVCPDIQVSPYYNKIYKDFLHDFAPFPYAIGGAQPLEVNDPNVLGYVTAEEHAANMRDFCVMFYHSIERNHIHYHPFEAMRAGMPLVFMAGGMLDRMGGMGQPGRCTTVKEARKKIERILGGDQKFIEEIRQKQMVMLDPMRPENCEDEWRAGFDVIFKNLRAASQIHRPSITIKQKKRIALILPTDDCDDSLQNAKLMAKVLYGGVKQSCNDVEIVLAYPNTGVYAEGSFSDLPPAISQRTFKWKNLNSVEAKRAMRYANYAGWEPSTDIYQVPDDGINQFTDCDLLIMVKDYLVYPLLPAYSYICMALGTLQGGGATDLPDWRKQSFLNAARQAKKVWVTDDLAYERALQHVGIPKERLDLVRLRMEKQTAYPMIDCWNAVRTCL